MYIARAIFVVLVGIVLVSAVPSQATGQEKKAEKTEKAEKPKAAAARRHVGTVKAVDSAAGMLTVTEKEGDAAVSIGVKTTIKKGKESLKLSDLKTGDKVTVVYVKEDGKDVAHSVTVKDE